MRLSIKTIIIMLLSLPTMILLYLTIDSYIPFELSDYTKYFYNTFIYVSITTLLSLIIGTTSAFLISCYNIPYRSLLTKLYIIPLVFPTYMMAMLYGELDRSFMNIWGLIFVTTLVSVPYVFIIMYSHISSISNTYMDTADTFKISNSMQVKKILIPLITTGLLSSSLIVISDCISEFGASVFFNVNTIMVAIYTQWFTLFNTGVATVISSILVSVLFVLFYIKSIYNKNIPNPMTHSENRLKYTKYGTLFSIILFIPTIFSVFVPFVLINKWAVLSYNHIDYTNVMSITGNTLMLALGVILITAVLSISMIYLFKNNKIVSALQSMNYALPGLLLSILLLSSISSMSNTIAFSLMLFAFVVKYNLLMTNSIDGYVSRIDRKLYYSTKSIGKSSFWYVINIQTPLVYKGILLGSMLVFIDVIRELPITLTLRPYNFETLSTKIFYYYNSEWIYHTAPYFIVMVLCTLPIIIFLMRQIDDKN